MGIFHSISVSPAPDNPEIEKKLSLPCISNHTDPIILDSDEKHVHLQYGKTHYRFPLSDLRYLYWEDTFLFVSYSRGADKMCAALGETSDYMRFSVEMYFANAIHKFKCNSDVVITKTDVLPLQDVVPPECHLVVTGDCFILRDKYTFSFSIAHLRAIRVSPLEGVNLLCEYDMDGARWSARIFVANTVSNIHEFVNEVQNFDRELPMNKQTN